MKIVPKKSLGQNFLLNKNIIKKIVELGGISNESNVIEIGPGTGNLTEELYKKKPKKLIVIEKDDSLISELKKKFSSNIQIINKDVLTVEWENYKNQNIILFGNLPYNISAQLMVNLIRLNELNKIFNKFILMFQKEVADRIVAEVNSSKYGRLTIMTNWKLKAIKIMDIDPENFFPRPKVKSSLVYFEPKSNFFFIKNPKNLEKVTNIFFQNKRKMIKKPLNILFKNSKNTIKKLNIDEKLRPQNLNSCTFFKISKEYEDNYI